MDYMPLIMMGLMGLAAGWIASQVLGQRSELVGNVVTGVVGAYVGGAIQQYAKIDVMKLGNPLLDQLAILADNPVFERDHVADFGLEIVGEPVGEDDLIVLHIDGHQRIVHRRD